MNFEKFVEFEKPVPTKYTLITGADLLKLHTAQWIVKDLIPRNGLVVIYGASMSGKSFLSLDLGLAIAGGAQWFGRPTKVTPVVYFPLEGARGGTRNLAWVKHNDKQLPEKFCEVDRAAFGLDDQSNVDGIISAVLGFAESGAVVIIDTLARAAAGVEENSTKEMGLIVKAAEEIASKVDGVVILVHHTGKDGSKGMRGSSVLIGAVDAAIEVNRTPAGLRNWKVAKVKDGEDGATEHFKLTGVQVGFNDWGEIRSCAVQWCEPDPKDAGVGLGPNQVVVLAALRAALSTAQGGISYAPPGVKALKSSDALRVGKEALVAAGCCEKSKASTRYYEVVKAFLRLGTLVTAGAAPHLFPPDKPDKVIWLA